MTSEQKAVNIVNILTRDYAPLIGLDGIGLYAFLTRLEASSLGKFSVELLSENLNKDEDDVICLLNKLRICKLIEYKISKSGDKYRYSLLEFKSISQAEKLHCLDIMEEEEWITDEEKEQIEEIITIQHIPKNAENTKVKTRKKKEKKHEYDIDLRKIISNRNPDSFPALVDDYYKMISKYFGGYYKSYNVPQEARLLKLCMREHNDNPEITRKMMDYLISDAAKNGRIEYVYHIGRYVKLRGIAYCKITNGLTNTMNFIGPGVMQEESEINMDDVKKMYDYYKQNGLEIDIIVKDILTPYYGENAVQKFLQTMGEANV